ncbi:MAG: hypothetical protein J5656_06775 [Clostridia bacterium]|nr:hypothetical protein [Clostridia bacterium]
MAKTQKYVKGYENIPPELLAEYRKLADRADKRMLRLERLAKADPEFANVTDYAYKKAQEDAIKWGSKASAEKGARFAINPPKTAKEINAKMKDIRAFLDKPTSTKSGIVKSYKKRAEGLNKLLPKGEEKLTWQEYRKFFKDANAKNMDSRFGYRTLTKAFSMAKKLSKKAKEEKDKKVLNQILDARKGKEVKFTDNNVVNEALKALYKEG